MCFTFKFKIGMSFKEWFTTSCTEMDVWSFECYLLCQKKCSFVHLLTISMFFSLLRSNLGVTDCHCLLTVKFRITEVLVRSQYNCFIQCFSSVASMLLYLMQHRKKTLNLFHTYLFCPHVHITVCTFMCVFIQILQFIAVTF